MIIGLLVIGPRHSKAQEPSPGSSASKTDPSAPAAKSPLLYPESKLIPDDGAEGDEFGWALQVSGDVAAIGAYVDDDKWFNSGSVYLYRRGEDGWKQEAKVIAAKGGFNDHFGESLSISGGALVVGAHSHDGNRRDSGAAYVFTLEEGEWTQMAKLVPDDNRGGDNFGKAVAIDGDTIVVGALGNDEAELNAGAAYVYAREGGEWTLQSKLMARDARAEDSFGYRVAIDGDLAVISAPGADTSGANSGAAYVFRRADGAWEQAAKLIAGDGTANDLFSLSIAVLGDEIIVGVPGDSSAGASSGSVQVFSIEGRRWRRRAKLQAGDSFRGERFGAAVDIQGGKLLVGAYGPSGRTPGTGAAYLFERIGTAWIEKSKLLPGIEVGEDEFGGAVALAGDQLMVASRRDDAKAKDMGSVFLFPMP